MGGTAEGLSQKPEDVGTEGYTKKIYEGGRRALLTTPGAVINGKRGGSGKEIRIA